MLLVDRSLLAATRRKGQRAAVSTGRRRRSRRDGNVPFVMWQLIWRPLTRWACEMCSVVARLGGAFLLAPTVCGWVDGCVCVCVRTLFRQAAALFTSHLKANYSVHQNARLFFQLLVTVWARLILCRASAFSSRFSLCPPQTQARLAVGRLAKSGFVCRKTFDLSVYTFVYFSWQDVKPGRGGKASDVAAEFRTPVIGSYFTARQTRRRTAFVCFRITAAVAPRC